VAETTFILDRPEQARLVEFLLEEGVTFVPAMHYKQRKYLKLTSTEKVMDVITSESLSGPLIILSRKFTRYPLRMFSYFWEWAGEKRYAMHQRYGGPYLDMSPAKCLTDHDPALITTGTIGHYPSFYCGPRDEPTEVPAPEELKALYKASCRFLRKICKRVGVKGVRRVYWVGKDTMQRFQAGEAISNMEGLEGVPSE